MTSEHPRSWGEALLNPRCIQKKCVGMMGAWQRALGRGNAPWRNSLPYRVSSAVALEYR